jgi:hypothetical protein
MKKNPIELNETRIKLCNGEFVSKARESEKSQIRVYRSSIDCEMKESKISIELKEE